MSSYRIDRLLLIDEVMSKDPERIFFRFTGSDREVSLDVLKTMVSKGDFSVSYTTTPFGIYTFPLVHFFLGRPPSSLREFISRMSSLKRDELQRLKSSGRLYDYLDSERLVHLGSGSYLFAHSNKYIRVLALKRKARVLVIGGEGDRFSFEEMVDLLNYTLEPLGVSVPEKSLLYLLLKGAHDSFRAVGFTSFNAFFSILHAFSREMYLLYESSRAKYGSVPYQVDVQSYASFLDYLAFSSLSAGGEPTKALRGLLEEVLSSEAVSWADFYLLLSHLLSGEGPIVPVLSESITSLALSLLQGSVDPGRTERDRWVVLAEVSDPEEFFLEQDRALRHTPVYGLLERHLLPTADELRSLVKAGKTQEAYRIYRGRREAVVGRVLSILVGKYRSNLSTMASGAKELSLALKQIYSEKDKASLLMSVREKLPKHLEKFFNSFFGPVRETNVLDALYGLSLVLDTLVGRVAKRGAPWPVPEGLARSVSLSVSSYVSRFFGGRNSNKASELSGPLVSELGKTILGEGDRVRYQVRLIRYSEYLRNIGYDAIVDPGYGAIHPNEPVQAVILNDKAIEVSVYLPNLPEVLWSFLWWYVTKGNLREVIRSVSGRARKLHGRERVLYLSALLAVLRAFRESLVSELGIGPKDLDTLEEHVSSLLKQEIGSLRGERGLERVLSMVGALVAYVSVVSGKGAGGTGSLRLGGRAQALGGLIPVST